MVETTHKTLMCVMVDMVKSTEAAVRGKAVGRIVIIKIVSALFTVLQ